MLNYLKKFAVDIFPSVAATVIGAYIVNHYIVARPTADTPPAAAASTANPKVDGKAEAKSESKPAETTASVSNLPAAGVKAKGISEKAVMEKTAGEKSAAAEKAQGKRQQQANHPVEHTHRHCPPCPCGPSGLLTIRTVRRLPDGTGCDRLTRRQSSLDHGLTTPGTDPLPYSPGSKGRKRGRTAGTRLHRRG